MKNLNIILLGKTGHGKSSTGNTILQEERFFVGDTLTSFTKMVERFQIVIGEYNVQVYDTPGPCDTEHGTADIAKICPLMESMIAACEKNGGVHAFFLVLNINTKMTTEEMLTIKILEGIFGRRVFHEFGVLVFTHGDNLQEDFVDWCANQDRKVQTLLDKFRKKVVVTNQGLFLGERLQCSHNMIDAAIDLNNLNRVYTLRNYKMSESSRTSLLVDSKKDELMAQFLEQINALDKEINGLKSFNKPKADYFLSKINEISGGIKQANQGTNVLDCLCVHVEKLKLLVEIKKQKCTIL